MWDNGLIFDPHVNHVTRNTKDIPMQYMEEATDHNHNNKWVSNSFGI